MRNAGSILHCKYHTGYPDKSPKPLKKIYSFRHIKNWLLICYHYYVQLSSYLQDYDGALCPCGLDDEKITTPEILITGERPYHEISRARRLNQDWQSRRSLNNLDVTLCQQEPFPRRTKGKSTHCLLL